MQQPELIPHLFRTEYSRITAVLCKKMGIEHIETAEDIAGETFLAAIENWTYKGLPENPTAWLYTVAKNKAKNYYQRSKLFTETISKEIKYNSAQNEEMEIDLSEQHIQDSQLQMLFTLCHPSISAQSQIGLSLRILCGFGIDEIANAFLTNKETIHKRLTRAKEKLRLEKVAIVFPDKDEIPKRLETVLTTLYLLFNEGYYSESKDTVLRNDLCLEAMRLTRSLINHTATDLPAVNALYALMCFHVSRFEARKDENGDIILYDEQDENLWDRELITQGGFYLHKASKGDTLSRYHLEAGIAYWHTIKEDTKEKWENILQLFNHLLQVAYSPIAALNRTYALSKAHSKQVAIIEAEKLNLFNNRFYHSLLGELNATIDQQKAKSYFENALMLAKTEKEKKLIQTKISRL